MLSRSGKGQFKVCYFSKLVNMAQNYSYTPKAIEEAKVRMKEYKDNVEYFNSKNTVLNNSDALILITEWKEFRSPDFEEMAKILKNKVIYDGRSQYKKETLIEHLRVSKKKQYKSTTIKYQ